MRSVKQNYGDFMLANRGFGETLDRVRATDAKDFANLMPRPGWGQQRGLGN